MTTAILSALPEEQSTLVQHLSGARRVTRAGRHFWCGHLCDRPVVLALSGIGKVAAATTTTTLIEHFGAQRVVFTGVAGGMGEGVRVGDLVVAHEYLQHDMDASPLFPRWEVPGYGRARLACDAGLTQQLLQACRTAVAQLSAEPASAYPDSRVHAGLVLSGDRFVSSRQEVQQLAAALGAAGHVPLAVEMEGAAVAQVCADYGLPLAAVRSISDRADDEASTDFTHFVNAVASRYAQFIVLALMGRI